jgi:inhibitor of KinA sporulation pathway (predicted exonuclease)
MIMKSENFFALDLELNRPNGDSPPRIIQVGLAIANIADQENIKSVSWHLDPQEPIDPEITELTGITDEIIREKSVPHETVARQLGELLRLYNVFTNPIVWGGTPRHSDSKELCTEFRERGIDFPFFGRRIIDVKTIYVFHQIVKNKTKSGSLSSAMNSYGLKFIGKPHRADVDARNTLRFFFHLVNRQGLFETYVQQVKDLK